MRVPTAVLVIAMVLPAAAISQPAGTDAESARAARMKAGYEAARGPQMGEGNPIPDPRRLYSAEEREAAYKARRTPAAPAAKPAEPAPLPGYFSPERDAVRAPYKTEAARANKAGEIRAGELSY
ncbi:hypothetical protein WKW79_22145 [Variovorax robiniae]|uniref:DUF4148 domain-containing protein n=1 Tax=Variovorax robiniae TaxID=1836199 RepID=A0ABU8XBW8_9BURK